MLGVGLSVIPRRPFPGTPPRTLDRQQMLIALGRGGRRRGIQYRILTGRDDHPGARGMLLNSGVDRRVVEDAVPDEASNGEIDLR